jgi:hypothetical protein
MNVDNTFLRELWKGAYFVDNEHYNKVCSKFMENLRVNWSIEKLKYEAACPNNLQRIEVFKPYLEWQSIPNVYFESNNDFSS